jgi:hypothetical protein
MPLQIKLISEGRNILQNYGKVIYENVWLNIVSQKIIS